MGNGVRNTARGPENYCLDHQFVRHYVNSNGIEKIREEIAAEKELEEKVMALYDSGKGDQAIASILKIPYAKVYHIITFDRVGLSYRKVGQKNKWFASN